MYNLPLIAPVPPECGRKNDRVVSPVPVKQSFANTNLLWQSCKNLDLAEFLAESWTSIQA